MGLENKMYCHREYETEENFDKEVKMHCFVLFYDKDSWYHFEHSNSKKRGIHKYDSPQAAIKEIIKEFNEKEIRELTEIPDVPDELTFKQFNQYVNSFEPVSMAELYKSR